MMLRLLNRPGLGEAIGSAICVAGVLVMLIAADPQVRDRFRAIAVHASSDGLNTWAERVDALKDAVLQSARNRSVDQAPLLVFTVIGGALLIFMLRT
jgi:hypothetical protein